MFVDGRFGVVGCLLWFVLRLLSVDWCLLFKGLRCCSLSLVVGRCCRSLCDVGCSLLVFVVVGVRVLLFVLGVVGWHVLCWCLLFVSFDAAVAVCCRR